MPVTPVFFVHVNEKMRSAQFIFCYVFLSLKFNLFVGHCTQLATPSSTQLRRERERESIVEENMLLLNFFF